MHCVVYTERCSTGLFVYLQHIYLLNITELCYSIMLFSIAYKSNIYAISNRKTYKYFFGRKLF